MKVIGLRTMRTHQGRARIKVQDLATKMGTMSVGPYIWRKYMQEYVLVQK